MASIVSSWGLVLIKGVKIGFAEFSRTLIQPLLHCLQTARIVFVQVCPCRDVTSGGFTNFVFWAIVKTCST